MSYAAACQRCNNASGRADHDASAIGPTAACRHCLSEHAPVVFSYPLARQAAGDVLHLAINDTAAQLARAAGLAAQLVRFLGPAGQRHGCRHAHRPAWRGWPPADWEHAGVGSGGRTIDVDCWKRRMLLLDPPGLPLMFTSTALGCFRRILLLVVVAAVACESDAADAVAGHLAVLLTWAVATSATAPVTAAATACAAWTTLRRVANRHCCTRAGCRAVSTVHLLSLTWIAHAVRKWSDHRECRLLSNRQFCAQQPEPGTDDGQVGCWPDLFAVACGVGFYVVLLLSTQRGCFPVHVAWPANNRGSSSSSSSDTDAQREAERELATIEGRAAGVTKTLKPCFELQQQSADGRLPKHAAEERRKFVADVRSEFLTDATRGRTAALARLAGATGAASKRAMLALANATAWAVDGRGLGSDGDAGCFAAFWAKEINAGGKHAASAIDPRRLGILIGAAVTVPNSNKARAATGESNVRWAAFAADSTRRAVAAAAAAAATVVCCVPPPPPSLAPADHRPPVQPALCRRRPPKRRRL